MTTQAQIIEAATALQDIRQLIRDFEDVPDPTDTDGQEVFNRARLAVDKLAALTAAAEVGEPQTSAEYHHRRGAAWDIIDQAIADYDSFMLDDDYNAQDALNKVIAKMKERRSFYLTTTAEVGEQTKDDWLRRESDLIAQIERATIERCAQYHDKAAEDCEKIAAVNMDNKLGADCLTRAQDHREDADAIRALKENP